ncbi:MAG: DinB family protein [Cyclobacteriaceae bacterium]
MTASSTLRSQLVQHLKGGMAFMPVEKMIEEIPFKKLGAIPEGLPYSLWQQFWHMMYAQKDIVEFSLKSDYTEPAWPDDYWPEEPAPKNQGEWDSAVKEFFHDREQLIKAIENDSTDLHAPLKNDPSKTLLREVLLVIEHNAYHTGQLLVIMRMLDLHN